MAEGVNEKLFPDADELMEGSMYRNLPDEPADFDDIIRGDGDSEL